MFHVQSSIELLYAINHLLCYVITFQNRASATGRTTREIKQLTVGYNTKTS